MSKISPHIPASTKYERLAERLRSQMLSGELVAGDRLPTFKEMREEFGATPTTVERVYKLLDDEGLIVRGKGRGIFVAEPPRRAATGVIGLSGVSFIRHLRHPYFVQLMEGVHEIISSADCEILILNEASTIEWEKVDGVLSLQSAVEGPRPKLPPGMPCVAVLTPLRGLTSVVADDWNGEREATEHLLEQGHRRIAFLHARDSTRRLAGYHEALRAAGIEPLADWVRFVCNPGGISYGEPGFNVMEQWLCEDWEQLGCTALLAQNDDAALGAIKALRARNLRVPQDVSVVGFDGTEVAELADPLLTTVAVPLREIGARGAQSLLQKMESNHARWDAATAPETIMLPTHLKLGESTAPPAAQQENVARR